MLIPMWSSFLGLFNTLFGWDANNPRDERLIFVVTMTLSTVISYWGMGLTYMYIESHNIFHRYKIQKDHKPDPLLVSQCIRHCLTSHALLGPFFYMLFPLFKYFGTEITAETIPSPLRILYELALWSLVNETLFYWLHRALHHRMFYGRIHKQHHQFKVPISICAAFANPIEDAVSNMMPFFIAPILMGGHMFTVCVWLIFRVWETIDAHSGYLLPWSPFTIISNNAAHHDFHHSHNVGAYGTFVHLWDRIMGTDAEFKRWWQKEGHRL